MVLQTQTGLNPEAAPFYPNQYVVVPTHQHYHPTLPLFRRPPFFPYHEVQQSYPRQMEEARDNFQKTKQNEAAEEVNEVECPKVGSSSRQRFFMRAIISGYGKRRGMEARRRKDFRPLPWADGGADHREVQVGFWESYGAFPRKNHHQHPLLPLRSDGTETAIMIKNIPNKYNREMLVEYLESHCLSENMKENKENGQTDEPSNVSAFDLVYLPIDFKSKLNKGYAFVNFTNPNGAWKFHKAKNNQKWDFFQSYKICDVVAARLQGKEKLEKHLDSMCFPYGREEVLPVCFSPPRDGTVKGCRRTLGKIIKSPH